jgi:uncharacterized membrane protein
MINKEERPKIKIKLTYPDWIIEFIGLSGVILLIALALYYLPRLPEKIPIHFNGAGTPDGFGSKASVWIIPVTGVCMYFLLTVLAFFPQIYNFPVKITQGNAFVQYRLATRFIRILKTLLLVLFVYLNYKSLETAMHKASGLGKAFMPAFLLIVFGAIIFYIVLALNNKQNS